LWDDNVVEWLVVMMMKENKMVMMLMMSRFKLKQGSQR
jgi:hypothetical protein